MKIKTTKDGILYKMGDKWYWPIPVIENVKKPTFPINTGVSSVAKPNKK